MTHFIGLYSSVVLHTTSTTVPIVYLLYSGYNGLPRQAYVVHKTFLLVIGNILTATSPTFDARVTGNQFGGMGGHHVLCSRHSFFLGLDLFRTAYCRKCLYSLIYFNVGN